MTKSSEVLLEASIEVLKSLGWDPAGSVIENILVGNYTSEYGSWQFYTEIFSDEALIVVRSILGETTPDKYKTEMVELIARCNDGLPRANLEFDLDSGLISCKSYLDLEGVDLEAMDKQGFLQPLIGRLLSANFATLDIFIDAIKKVSTGELSAAEADRISLED